MASERFSQYEIDTSQPMACGHAWIVWRRLDGSAALGDLDGGVSLHCFTCGDTQPLEPASDDSPAVQLEIELAERLAWLGALWEPSQSREILEDAEVRRFAARDPEQP